MSDGECTYGSYQLLLKLAVGGQAEIFLARHEGVAGFHKLVVIKRLLPHLARDTEFIKMLVDEARIVAQLSHPHVCQVYELGQVQGSYYLAMEYLEGMPLSRLLRHAADCLEIPDTRLVCTILRQACEGLHHAHELCDSSGQPSGVVHRDVSPSNLFVTVDGIAKVLDFGIAKARGTQSKTRTGTIKGKYEYMSPEQVRRLPLDRRSDVFSLGIVLYEALTVRRLFYRDSEYEVFRAVTDEPIPLLRQLRPTVPVELEQVVARALARDPDERFATARELGHALDAAVSGLGPEPDSSVIGEYVRCCAGGELTECRAALQASAARAALMTAQPLGRSDTAWSMPDLSASQGDEMLVETIPCFRNQAAMVSASASLRAAMHEPPAKPAEPPLATSPRSWIATVAVVASAAIAAVLAVIAWRAHTAAPGRYEPALGLAKRPPAERDPYVAAFSRHEAEVQRCLAAHVLTSEQLGELTVKFRVELDGRVRNVDLEPDSLSGTLLGDCLEAVAMKTNFDEQERESIVRIPIRPRQNK